MIDVEDRAITFITGVLFGFLLFVLFVGCVAKEQTYHITEYISESEGEISFQEELFKGLLKNGFKKSRQPKQYYD